jgi:hypothetical protein
MSQQLQQQIAQLKIRLCDKQIALENMEATARMGTDTISKIGTILCVKLKGRGDSKTLDIDAIMSEVTNLQDGRTEPEELPVD